MSATIWKEEKKKESGDRYASATPSRRNLFGKFGRVWAPLVTFAHWITVFPIEYAKPFSLKGKRLILLASVSSRRNTLYFFFYEIYVRDREMDVVPYENFITASFLPQCIRQITVDFGNINISD